MILFYINSTFLLRFFSFEIIALSIHIKNTLTQFFISIFSSYHAFFHVLYLKGPFGVPFICDWLIRFMMFKNNENYFRNYKATYF